MPELRRADIREVFVGTYRLVYQVQADAVLVLTVFEGHRRLAGAGSESGSRVDRAMQSGAEDRDLDD